MARLNALQFSCSKCDCFFERNFLPFVGNRFADHWLKLTILVVCVTPSKATLYTRVTFVRSTVFVWRHANNGFALHFCLERATNSAICTRGEHGAARLTKFDNGVLGKRCCWARLHACTTRHARRVEEVAVETSGYARSETATFNGESECSLNFFTCTNATVTDDAL